MNDLGYLIVAVLVYYWIINPLLKHCVKRYGITGEVWCYRILYATAFGMAVHNEPSGYMVVLTWFVLVLLCINMVVFNPWYLSTLVDAEQVHKAEQAEKEQSNG